MPEDPAGDPTEPSLASLASPANPVCPVSAVSERLTAPLAYWLLGTGFVLSLGVAVFAFLGPVWGTAVTVVGEALLVALLVGYGSTKIVIADDGIGVGRSWIDYAHVSAVQALDERETLQRLRTRADPRAHLVVRPYVRTSLEITVDDTADPHPYWLVSSRAAGRLLARVPARLRPAASPSAGTAAGSLGG